MNTPKNKFLKIKNNYSGIYFANYSTGKKPANFSGCEVAKIHFTSPATNVTPE